MKMHKKERKTSITRKLIGILVVLGIVTALMCYSNLGAFGYMEGFYDKLTGYIVELETYASGPEAEQLIADTDYILERIQIRIDGTVAFDVILVIMAGVVTLVASWLSYRMIGKPTKQVSAKLGEIVDSIRQKEGDLTARIDMKSKDEIGQMAANIDIFVELLQGQMNTIRDSAQRLNQSIVVVNDKMVQSNSSITNVSSSTEELAASMETVAATIDEIAEGSAGTRHQRKCRFRCKNSVRASKPCFLYE